MGRMFFATLSNRHCNFTPGFGVRYDIDSGHGFLGGGTIGGGIAEEILFGAQDPRAQVHHFSAFADFAISIAFPCDGKLLAVGDLTGTVHVFDAKSQTHLRRLKGHSATARLMRYPRR
ncbi:U3 small nucleolar RNA-associated protein [Forsythia ovata]|uniref:U3 small nucleolar RNA-associated protein n=1 Tax=Forsythia ovata TaxID=205694 RepID=A0ABD1SML3_9LAMI